MNPRPLTNFLFEPLIYAPPSHPGNVLTALMYTEGLMTQHGVTVITRCSHAAVKNCDAY